jgi:3-hydroxyisobutyrate dehydrogenase-like beta-hydroxyacid dehydrogenase
MTTALAIIGFGEAGESFARAGRWGVAARAFDILPSRADAMAGLGIVHAASGGEAVTRAPLILSLVTADQALAAARTAAPHLTPGALWCDMNSVAPDTKRAAAAVIEGAGARYADVAILAPVNPARLAVPLLISGPAAEAAETMLRDLGFSNVRTAGDAVGRASAIKMIRSVMIKGIEALTDEMMEAATRAGVANEVLASLDASEKPVRWADRADYNLERMTTHGLRRAAEMEEVAATLAALGVDPLMTRGTVQRQRTAATRRSKAA